MKPLFCCLAMMCSTSFLAEPVELPTGKTSLLDIGCYEIGYQSYGKPVVMMPTGWIGDMMNDSGIANKETTMRGSRALLLHSPWRVEPGRTFQDYQLKLPVAKKITLDFGYGMGDGVTVKGKSDGVEFTCQVWGKNEKPRTILKQFTKSEQWTEVTVDLTPYSGKSCTIRFQTEPGPDHDASFDYSYFRNPTITAGLVTEQDLGIRIDRMLAQNAIQMQLKTPLTAVRNRSGQGVIPSNRYAGRNRLHKVAGGWDFSYTGPDCAMVIAYRPSQGTLDDFTLSYNGGKPFAMAANGQLCLGEKITNQFKSTVVSMKQDGQALVAVIRYDLLTDKTDITATWRFEMIGKALAIEVSCDKPLAQGLNLGRTGAMTFRRFMNIPYLHGSLEFTPATGLYSYRRLDWTRSDASQAFISSTYFPKTDGKRNLLHDFAYIAYSPDPAEVLPNIPFEPSKYRETLAPRIMLDFWGSPTASFADDGKLLRELKDHGVDTAAIIYHNWQRYGYDVKLPDHLPANPRLGGDPQMAEFGKAANDCGYLWSLHENYIDLYPDAPSFTEKAVVLMRDGKWSKAWYNGGTKVQSYGLKCNYAMGFAKQNAPEIHRRFKTTAGYLDVHTCVSPSHQLDYDATQPMAANAHHKVLRDKELFDFMRATHEGPFFGEGGGHFYWAGACDGTEAQVAGGDSHRPFLDFDLLKLHPQMVNHGMGYYERWNPKQYSLVWGLDAGSQDRIDMYRAQEVAYGHAGFVSNRQCFNIPWVVREYHLVHPVQALYGAADVTQILYDINGKRVPAAVALAMDHTERQLITYDNGTTVYVNWGKEPWRTEHGVLPQWSYCAIGKDTFVKAAYEAKPGVFADYVECPEYVFADARTSFDMPYLKQGRQRAAVRVSSFKYLGGDDFELTYEWTPLVQTDLACMCFVHFLNQDVKNTNQSIVFQQDHALPVQTNVWPLDKTVVDGPYKITVRGQKFSTYDVTIGIYDKNGRKTLKGNLYDGGRYLLGTLKVTRDNDQRITDIAFVPVSQKDDSLPRALDFTARVNPAGTLLSFGENGKIVTDGSVRVQRDGNTLVVFPYPRDKVFTIRLDTAQFGLGSPVGLKVSALSAMTQSPMGDIPCTVNGRWLEFQAGAKGAGRFVISK